MAAEAQSEPATTPRTHGAAASQWPHWLITFVAIALPILVVLVRYSVPEFALTWHQVNVAIERGDFLVPVLILCLESIRCWCSEVTGTRRWTRVSRLICSAWCGFAAVTCLIAMTYAASVGAVTANIGHSIEVITGSSFFTAAVLGTVAVDRASRRVRES